MAMIDDKTILINESEWSPAMCNRVAEGRYEVAERRVLRDILSADDRVVEIGGGIGLIALVCSDIVRPSNVTVFEANPDLVEDVRANFRANGVDISIYQNAVVANDYGKDRIDFNLANDFWSGSLISTNNVVRSIEVPAIKLDDVITVFRPSILIIDVEGYEVELLSGADLRGVQKILLETHYRYAGKERVNEMIAHLFSIGFRLDLPRSQGEVVFLDRACP